MPFKTAPWMTAARGRLRDGGPRLRRGAAFVSLAALVLLLHGALLKPSTGPLGRPLPAPGRATEAVHMQVVLQAPPVAPVAADDAAAPQAEAAVPPAAPPPEARAQAGPQRDPTATAATHDPEPLEAPPPATANAVLASEDSASKDLASADSASAEATPQAPAAPEPAALAKTAAPAVVADAGSPALPASATSAAQAEPSATAPRSAPQEAPPAGSLPPVYAVDPPQDRNLACQAQRGQAIGVGRLSWQARPDEYTLGLTVDVAGGPALDWLSRGSFDQAGLAPQRMVERQRGRDVHAVNFQRDKHLISFSGPSSVTPLLPGAQDRLSWLIQLSAVVQAARGTLKEGDTLRFQVASPRGDVDDWVFTLGALSVVELAGTRWPTLKLVREPQRPYDQRVEVWLVPSASHLPLGLKLTTVPGGVPLELWCPGGLRLEL